MNLIKKIEIQYFRSIYWESITEVSGLNVLTGKNDAGKSNVLKALNLFFNNQTDSGVDFDFNKDFNLDRLEEVRKETVKGKQFIQIKITFIRGNQYKGTLPEVFTVTKKWLRNDTLPTVTDNIQQQLEKAGKKYSDRSKSSLTLFLKKISYMYIPAVKDEKTFGKVLSMLQECVFSEKLSTNKQLTSALDTIACGISTTVGDINEEFKTVTGVETSVNPPRNLHDFYNRSLSIYTKYGNNEVGLDHRGDGIRVRYIPSILNYIASNSKQFSILGFEEPENSLEYNLALELAESFYSAYSKKSIMFLTTHSPAFISLHNRLDVQLYRCFNNRDGKTVGTIIIKEKDLSKKKEQYPKLEEELGYFKIQQDIYEQYHKLIMENETTNALVSALQKELKSARKPVVLTEGKTDALILKEAWHKLYNKDCPYEIKSCSITDENEVSCAGCDILAKYLESYRFDSDHIVVGIFDRDKAGINAYKLDKNYIETPTKQWKTSKNNKAYAFMLPIPVGKEKFAENENLCIEFLFERSDLEKKVEGVGLGLVPPMVYQTCRGKQIGSYKTDDFSLFEIDKDTKTYFAEKIVQTLPKEAFVHFKLIFELLETIISSQVSD
jgi:predicted ATP-dependent endonuclease of OLD family